MPDDLTPDDATIPLDIAIAGPKAITHYRSQVAALLATGESVADASASVLDQWETIHGPHLRATHNTSTEATGNMTPLATS